MKRSGALRIEAPSEREIVMTRVFDAPRPLVFDALTRPDLLRRWLIEPSGWNLTVCQIDLREGGSYRLVWRGVDGSEVGMRGVFVEVVPPALTVNTEGYDRSWYPGEAVVTTCLVEEAGRTTLTGTVLYESREARDVVLESGLERGAGASYDRLDKLTRRLSGASLGYHWLHRAGQELRGVFGRPV